MNRPRRRGRPPRDTRLVAGAPAHLVRFRDLASKHSLGYWAAKSLAEEVYGLQASNTLDANGRDLAAFVRWFADAAGEGAVDAWLPRHTHIYLDRLEQQGTRYHR